MCSLGKEVENVWSITTSKKSLSLSFFFTFADPPQIDTTRPAERNLTFGYPAKLVCLVSGIPKPEITWTGPDEKPVIVSESNARISINSEGSLILSQAQLSDIGPWTCEAINSVGTASRQIEIQAIYSKFYFKESTSLLVNLEKFSIHFSSSSFVIRVNLLLP